MFPVQGCVASASQAHHDYPAADIFAVGSQSRLTRVGPDGNASVDANDPAIAYNSVDDEFLMVWAGTTVAGAENAFGNCQGWTGMLAAMKVWLEHGINLRDGFYA